MQIVRVNLIATILMTMIASGCNDRANRIAIQAADRQAEQNRAMIDAQKDIADGSRQLVASDAEARRQHVELQRALQNERAELGAQWKQLEAERQGLAKERRRESLFAPIVQALGGLLLVVVTIGFSWYALARSRSDGGNAALEEFLVQELLDDSPANRPIQRTRDESERLIEHRSASQRSEFDKGNEPC